MSTAEELEAARARRSEQLDAFVDAFIALCMTDYRIDALLEQLQAERAAEQPGRMA